MINVVQVQPWVETMSRNHESELTHHFLSQSTDREPKFHRSMWLTCHCLNSRRISDVSTIVRVCKGWNNVEYPLKIMKCQWTTIVINHNRPSDNLTFERSWKRGWSDAYENCKWGDEFKVRHVPIFEDVPNAAALSLETTREKIYAQLRVTWRGTKLIRLPSSLPNVLLILGIAKEMQYSFTNAENMNRQDSLEKKILSSTCSAE